MFKKDVTANIKTHQLGGKEAKKIKEAVSQKFASSLTDEDKEKLVPKSVIKLTNMAVVYAGEDGNPLFFDPTGHGDKFIPTIAALRAVPHLVPSLYTWSEVSSKILGGADLFLQGLLIPEGGLDPFLAGSIRSVCVPGNPIPFAVGTMAVSNVEADREGMKGRGLTLLHTYGDYLWQLGDKIPPNEGFTHTRIHPIQTIETDGNGEGVGGGPARATASGIGAGNATLAESGIASLSLSPFDPKQQQHGATSLEIQGQGEGGGSSVGSKEQPTGPEMDALLEAAVLGGLQSLKTAELPIMTSDFYSKHMQPLKPNGITFDFKHSKYKKLGKLLDYFEKEKVLTQKHIRKQDHISAVNRTHASIVQWKGMPFGGGERGSNGNGGGKNGTSGGASSGNNSAAQGTTVELKYRASTLLRPIFGALGVADKDRLYTEAEIGQALIDYAKTQGLGVTGDPSRGGNMQVDTLLTSSLWGKKEEPSLGEYIPFVEVKRRLMDKMQQWHRITRMKGGAGGTALEVLRKGSPWPITITAEKRNGHSITLVARVEGFGYKADDLAGEFQRKLKTSAKVTKLPGKSESDSEIMLQGDLLKHVVAYFTTTEGIEAKHLETNNKLEKK